MTAALPIQYASKVITTVGTTVRLKPLPPNSRTLATYAVVIAAPTTTTITPAVTAAGATTVVVSALNFAMRSGTALNFGAKAVTLIADADKGATSIRTTPVPTGGLATTDTASYTPTANALNNTEITVAATSTFIDAGEILSFGGTLVTITKSAAVGALNLFCRALSGAVTGSASTKGLVALVGATDASPSSQPKTTDTSNYLSGVGDEMAIVGVSRTLNVTFNEIEGDLGGIIIKAMLFTDQYYDREIYAIVQRPNGEIYEGAAIVTQGQGQAPVREKVTRTANFQFEGASFIYTPPTIDANKIAPLFS